MADDKTNAAEYWKANVRLIFGCLAVWAFVSYGCAILFRPLLAGIPVGGTDLLVCTTGLNPNVYRADLLLCLEDEQARSKIWPWGVSRYEPVCN